MTRPPRKPPSNHREESQKNDSSVDFYLSSSDSSIGTVSSAQAAVRCTDSVESAEGPPRQVSVRNKTNENTTEQRLITDTDQSSVSSNQGPPSHILVNKSSTSKGAAARDKSPRLPKKRGRPKKDDSESPARTRGRPRDESEKPAKKWGLSPKKDDKLPSSEPSLLEDKIGKGDRVYAEWKDTNQWYWATVTDITRKKHSCYDQFSLRYDDGDFEQYASRRHILSAAKYSELYKDEPPPPAPQHRYKEADEMVTESVHDEHDSQTHGRALSPRQLYVQRCNDCTLCHKPDCQSCYACKLNQTATSNHRTEVCLQKMCLRIADEDKRQPAVGFPSGWTFLFKEARRFHDTNKHHVPGLYIYSPNRSLFYRSAEAAIARKFSKVLDNNPNAIHDFYSHIGIQQVNNAHAALPPQKPAPSLVSASSATSTDSTPILSQNGCGKCPNCLKRECGQCAECRVARPGGQRCCFQKMCFELPVEEKAQDAKGFPQGWKFYFAQDRAPKGPKKFKRIPGLYILSPGNKRHFRSAEAAVSTNAFKPEYGTNTDDVVRVFYEDIGLANSMESSPSVSASRSHPSPLSQPSPQELHEERVLSNRKVNGARVYVKWHGDWYWGKIVGKVPHPDQYNAFRYCIGWEMENTVTDDVLSEDIMTEAEYRAWKGEDPPPPPDTVAKSTDHFLVGKRCCFAWKDLKNRNKIVYGQVVEVEKSLGNELIRCRVVYSVESAAFVNKFENDCDLAVPNSQWLPSSLVVGGCILYCRKLGHTFANVLPPSIPIPYNWTWISPDSRLDEMVNQGNGKELPRLNLIVRNFSLTLSVKPSTIPTAGYGVFINATCIAKDDIASIPAFELEAGELIDLGIYAPFQPQDLKPESVFFAKNFVHGHKCEEWSFNSSESGKHREYLDITNETNGDLHSLASSCVPAYVNECDCDANVVAEHDPEGSVHYLLGHPHRSQGRFILQEGHEMELFVYYGLAYEKVRVRKGYSFLPEEDQEELLHEIANEDVENVKEFNRFSDKAIRDCVNHFCHLFATEEESVFASSTIQRALVCAVVLQWRAFRLALERADKELKELLKASGRLVSRLLDMARENNSLKGLQVYGDYETLAREILNNFFSREDFDDLDSVFD